MDPRLLFAKLHVRQMLLVAVILVPSVVILLLQSFQEHKQAEVLLALQARSVASRIGMHSKDLLPNPEMYLSQLGTLPEVFSGKQACNAFMKVSLRADYFFHNLFVVAPNGEITCSGVDLNESVTLSSRPYFQRALASKKFVIGNYQLTRDKLPIIVFALPLMDNAGNVTAVIGASAHLTWFQKAFSDVITNTSLTGIGATAIDEGGVVIASATNQQVVGMKARDWDEEIKKAALTGEYVRTETWRNGTVRTTAYLPIYRSSASNVYLRVGVPQDKAMAEVRGNVKRRFAFLLVFAIVSALASWLLGVWLVVRPIRRLTATAILLGTGKLDARTGIRKSDGEINELAVRIDIMADEFEAQHNTLSQLTRVQALRGKVNVALLHAKDEQALLMEVCSIVSEHPGFQIAWVGYVHRKDSSRLIRQAWSTSDPKTAAMVADTIWGDEEVRNDPVFAAIRSGAVCVVRDVGDKTVDPRWGAALARLGCKAAVGYPIVASGAVIGGLGIYCRDTSAFDDAQVKMLIETANDLGVGIGALRASQRLRQSRELLKTIVDNIPTMIFLKDARDFSFISMNRAGEKLTGLQAEKFVGKTDFDLFSFEQASYFREKDRATLSRESEIIVGDEVICARDGESRIVETKKLVLWAQDGSPKYLLGISEDITERRETERRLKHLATHDHLTGLVNRQGLLMQFQEDWPTVPAYPNSLALLYIDLDGFKEINDTLGHAVGDELLKTVACRLAASVPNKHTVARVGGDEFIILVRDAPYARYSVDLAENICARCEKPFVVDGHEIFISTSIGISLYPGPIDGYEALLTSADIAMYAAKAQGRNGYAVYTPDMRVEAAGRVAMRNRLRHAIEQNELTLHYQPRVSLATGKIVGAEALLRWNSVELGSTSPAVFIPLAEESGQIVAIGAWVLRQACIEANKWKSRCSDPFHIAVNLSPRQLRHTGLINTIRAVLDESGLPPEALELEITESALMDKDSNSIDMLNEISAMGIRLAVDDFGTGYSNLGYLKQLPLNVLKIDQSFIRGVTGDSSDRALVTAIVAMAKSLSLEVTAEGIETSDQLAIVRALGVSDYQGYYFSRPVPAVEFDAMLDQQNVSAR